MIFESQIRHKLSSPILIFWVRHLQQTIASLGNIWRHPVSSLTTITIVGVCLALLVTFYLSLKNVCDAIPSWQKSTQIRVFVDLNARNSDLQQLIHNIRQLSEVSSLKLIPKAQGLTEFEQKSGLGKAISLLSDNPLPDVLMVIPSRDENSPRHLQLLKRKLKKFTHVGQVQLDIEWLKRFKGILAVIDQSLTLLIVLLLSSILLIVSNTIRLNILNQLREIEIMKLVGATNSFVQLPFLYIGFWYGFIGGLLAWLLSDIMILWLGSAVEHLTKLYRFSVYLKGLSIIEFVLLILFSSGLCMLISWFSVRLCIKRLQIC